jgi:hypothetical protein
MMATVACLMASEAHGVEEQPGVAHRFGRKQRDIQVGVPPQGSLEGLSRQQAGGGDGGSEQIVLDRDELVLCGSGRPQRFHDQRHEALHGRAGEHANAHGPQVAQLLTPLGDAPLQEAHAPNPVLDLLEPVVSSRRRKVEVRDDVQLVCPIRPVRAPLHVGALLRGLQGRHGRATLLPRGLPHQVVLAVLGEAHGYDRHREHRRAQGVEVVEGAAQHVAVVHPGLQNDLRVELDSALREGLELRQDRLCPGMAQQAAAHHRIGRVYRDVEWREPVFENSLHVPRFQVGERREVAVPEREAVVVVADVQGFPQSLRKTVHEAEVTAVGAAPDAWGIELDAQGGVVGPFHVELHGLPIRGACQQHEALLGG